MAIADRRGAETLTKPGVINVLSSSLKEVANVISKLHVFDTISSVSNIGVKKVGGMLTFSFIGATCAGNSSVEIIDPAEQEFSCIVSSKVFSDVLLVIAEAGGTETASISIVKDGKAMQIKASGRKFEVRCLDEMTNIFPAIVTMPESPIKIPKSMFVGIEYVSNAYSPNGVHTISRCVYFDIGFDGKLFLIGNDMKKLLGYEVPSNLSFMSDYVMNSKSMKNLFNLASKHEDATVAEKDGFLYTSFGNSVVKSTRMDVKKMPIAKIVSLCEKLTCNISMKTSDVKSGLSDVTKVVSGDLVSFGLDSSLTMQTLAEDMESTVVIAGEQSNFNGQTMLMFSTQNMHSCISKLPCQNLTLKYFSASFPIMVESKDEDGNIVFAVVAGMGGR